MGRRGLEVFPSIIEDPEWPFFIERGASPPRTPHLLWLLAVAASCGCGPGWLRVEFLGDVRLLVPGKTAPKHLQDSFREPVVHQPHACHLGVGHHAFGAALRMREAIAKRHRARSGTHSGEASSVGLSMW